MTRHDAPLQRRAAARARSKCGGSAWPGGRALRLQRRAAPTHAAHAAAAHERSPAHLRMMMSETPPHPRPRQEREARIALSVSSSAKRTASSTSPPPRGNARVIGGGTCRHPGAQRPRHRRRARSARRRLGCRRRPGAQRPRHRRRARSAWRLWQPAAAPPGTQARSALGAQRRAPSAERVAQAEIRLAAGAGRTAPTPPAPSA